MEEEIESQVAAPEPEGAAPEAPLEDTGPTWLEAIREVPAEEILSQHEGLRSHFNGKVGEHAQRQAQQEAERRVQAMRETIRAEERARMDWENDERRLAEAEKSDDDLEYARVAREVHRKRRDQAAQFQQRAPARQTDPYLADAQRDTMPLIQRLADESPDDYWAVQRNAHEGKYGSTQLQFYSNMHQDVQDRIDRLEAKAKAKAEAPIKEEADRREALSQREMPTRGRLDTGTGGRTAPALTPARYAAMTTAERARLSDEEIDRMTAALSRR